MTIAHMTFSMAYVTVVVQSRMATFDTALEEAAMDLGCPPGEGVLLDHAAHHFPGDSLRLAARLHAVLG